MAVSNSGEALLVTPTGGRRNWWKIAFFVLLVAFEVTREFAVMESLDKTQPSVTPMVFGGSDWVEAQGRWARIDGGGPLMPGAVTIRCNQSDGKCIEASYVINDNFVWAPEISVFPATFSPDAVTYENELPTCAKYYVRIDRKLGKAFSVRERKNDAQSSADPNCAKLERRIESQLSDGYVPQERPLEGHFLPVMKVLIALFD